MASHVPGGECSRHRECSGGVTHGAVDVRGQGPVAEPEQAPDRLYEDVDAHKRVVEHVPQEARERVRQMDRRVAPAQGSNTLIQPDTQQGHVLRTIRHCITHLRGVAAAVAIQRYGEAALEGSQWWVAC